MSAKQWKQASAIAIRGELRMLSLSERALDSRRETCVDGYCTGPFEGHSRLHRPKFATLYPGYDRITHRARQCGEFPHAGGRVPEYDTDDIREVLEYPYRIIYRILSDRVDVLAVVHGARRLPDAPA